MWIAATLIILLLLAIWYRRRRLVPIYSNICGRTYRVIAGYDNRQEAAELLDKVNCSIMKLLASLKARYGRVDSLRGRAVRKLLRNYDLDNIYENDSVYSSDTTYTINKGDSISVCLRDKKNPEQLVDANILLFVMIHEAAHIANYDGWGHGTKFWSMFAFLLEEAIAVGIYRPIDYAAAPVEYCSLRINYNPLFDKSLPILE